MKTDGEADMPSEPPALDSELPINDILSKNRDGYFAILFLFFYLILFLFLRQQYAYVCTYINGTNLIEKIKNKNKNTLYLGLVLL